MFLRLGDDRAIIDDGTSADAARASSMGIVGLTKLPLASVWPTRSSVNWLAPAADRILMTIGASPRVEDGPKPAIDVVSQFVNLLVEAKLSPAGSLRCRC